MDNVIALIQIKIITDAALEEEIQENIKEYSFSECPLNVVIEIDNKILGHEELSKIAFLIDEKNKISDISGIWNCPICNRIFQEEIDHG